MGRRLTSTLFWAFLAASSALLFPLAVVVWATTAPFDRRRAALHRFTCAWASLYTWVNPLWPVTIRGRERIDPDTTYVFVANHLSLLDILVLFRLFTHFKWVSKLENFNVPFIGWNMRLNGYIPLRRGDKESVRKMMAASMRALESGSSIMMFPEGTRSRTGELQPFKPGAFDLALRTRSPILPIVVEGTHHALPKRGFVLRGRHPINITVLEPIRVEEFADRSPAELAELTRGRIAAALGDDATPATTPPGPDPARRS
jgi:1-acyl-sn-glycerol-3-phosphate acyltransferase